MFIWKDAANHAVVYQKVAKDAVRYVRALGVHKYLKNESVEDLGTDYQLPELTKFEQLNKGHFFVFADTKTVYQKLSVYYIRRIDSIESIYYNMNGEVQDLGEEISQFTQPIHSQTENVRSGE